MSEIILVEGILKYQTDSHRIGTMVLMSSDNESYRKLLREEGKRVILKLEVKDK